MFDRIPAELLIIGSTVLALGMGTLAVVIRSRAAKKPVSAKKIILPPLFMSTGALMFIFEEFRVPPLQILEALLVGFIFSFILMWSSKFEVKKGEVYLKRSKAFIYILIGLLVFRVIAKLILSSTIDIGELGGMFWILAFGMLVPWRIAMLVQYRRLATKLKKLHPQT